MVEQKDSVRAWALEHHGAQKAIAEFFGVGLSHVSAVLRQKHYSSGGKIESVLADLGAPGMRKRASEARAKFREIGPTQIEIARLLKQLKKIKANKRAA